MKYFSCVENVFIQCFMERYFFNIPLMAFKCFSISNILIFIYKPAINLLTSSLFLYVLLYLTCSL